MRRSRSLWYVIAVLLAVSLAGYLNPSVASAADIKVGLNTNPNATYTSIQSAIDAASAGDTIKIQGGDYYEAIFIDKSLTLLGGYDASFNTRSGTTKIEDDDYCATITIGLSFCEGGLGFSSSFDRASVDASQYRPGVQSAARDGVSFQQDGEWTGVDLAARLQEFLPASLAASSFTPPISPNAIVVEIDKIKVTRDDDGSGIHILAPEDSQITLSNLEVYNGGFEIGGGILALMLSRTTLDISTTKIYDNGAFAGGGMFVAPLDCIFGCEGGSIIYGVTLRMDNVLFEDNFAFFGGGAYIFLQNSATVELTETEFKENGAFVFGGAAIDLFSQSTLKMNDVEYVGNGAAVVGAGVVQLRGSHAEFSDLLLISNYAGEDGPAGLEIDAYNSHIVADRITATGHGYYPEGDNPSGWALWIDLEANSAMTVTDAMTLTNNLAWVTAGARIEAENSEVHIARVYAENNHNIDGSGGALYVDSEDAGRFTFDDVEFIDNSSEDGGGALYIDGEDGAEVTIHGGTFEGNHSHDSSGGAIYVSGANDRFELNIWNTSFLSNTAEDYGGAIRLDDFEYGSILRMENNTFKFNEADDGGAIYASSGFCEECGYVLVNGNYFYQNAATGDGGAIYSGNFCEAGYCEFKDNLFDGNQAGSNGGAVRMYDVAYEGGHVIFTGNQFFNNSGDYGGGLWTDELIDDGGIVIFSSNIFSDNVAAYNGGGIRIYGGTDDGGSVTFSGNLFTGNSAGDDGDGSGGGLYSSEPLAEDSQPFTFTHNIFISNVASYNGGGLYVDDELAVGADLLFEHNTFSDNVALCNGGGIYTNRLADDGGRVRFRHNTLTNNSAGDESNGEVTAANGDCGYGGGIRAQGLTDGSMAWITSNVITGNMASGAGGGIYLGNHEGDFSAYLNISDNEISSNWAGAGGGCWIDQPIDNGSTLLFLRNNISGNVGYYAGGGCGFVAISEGTVAKFGNNTISDNSTLGAGGALAFGTIAEEVDFRFYGNSVTGNTAGSNDDGYGVGGGLYFDFFAVANNIQVTDNTFSGNQALAGPERINAEFFGFAPPGAGGAIFFGPNIAGFNQILLQDNVITDNHADTQFGGVGAIVGFPIDINNGSLNSGGRFTARGNLIDGNSAEAGAGLSVIALVFEESCQELLSLLPQGLAPQSHPHCDPHDGPELDISFAEVVIDGNQITNNSAGEDNKPGGLWIGTGRFGGNDQFGTLEDGPELVLNMYAYGLNNLIAGNKGDGLVVDDTLYHSYNDTIAHNSGYGLITSQYSGYQSGVNLTNGIIWGNTGPIEVGTNSPVNVTYTHIQGGRAGTGNLNADPLFVDPAAGNYRLQATSTAIDSANTETAPLVDLDRLVRPIQNGFDRGAYEWRIAGVDLGGSNNEVTLLPGGNACLDLTVTNESNYPDSYAVTLASSTLDWPVQLGCGDIQSAGTHLFTGDLAQDESFTIQVEVEVPDDAIGGQQNVLHFRVDSQSNKAVVDSLFVTVIAENVAGLVLTPNNNGSTADGTTIGYQHTLTNNGNFTDSITLAANSSEGWSAVVIPAFASLAPGASTSVHVSVTVPAGKGGSTDITTVTATSAAQAGVTTASATDTTSVPQYAGIALALGTAKHALPGETVTFSHRITNTGNGPDTFNLIYQSASGWTVNGLPSVSLASGASQIISFNVIVPANALGATDITTIYAASAFNGGVAAAAQDTTIVATAGVQLSHDNEGMMGISRSLVYTHTVVNTGSATDIFDVTYQSSSGWTVNGPSSVSVAAGAKKTIALTISLPEGNQEEVDVTTVTVTSRLDNTQQDSATDTTKRLDQSLFMPQIRQTNVFGN
jgi:predicted outer membrane repeat protein